MINVRKYLEHVTEYTDYPIFFTSKLAYTEFWFVE